VHRIAEGCLLRLQQEPALARYRDLSKFLALVCCPLERFGFDAGEPAGGLDDALGQHRNHTAAIAKTRSGLGADSCNVYSMSFLRRHSNGNDT
jgi:hypothetical protein